MPFWWTVHDLCFLMFIHFFCTKVTTTDAAATTVSTTLAGKYIIISLCYSQSANWTQV